MANYSSTSFYADTQQWGTMLDIWAGKTIGPDVNDALYQIDPVYNFRPDLLAHDIYKDTNLWWVFAVRNPDILTDPLTDFVAPNIIYIPSLELVNRMIGRG